ncbi:hypothetical protein [Cupriavidus sp. UME77]|uniref:hypothetical protein n=1 Tax=Cupriavidus sp. UME77 TaxID=1862321 RepID=UPI001600B8A8|nr:hypothetical protein [Cupriavidus sp. UME77]MBB1630262.1 hypothetical protein [Cupriavidus sp. UME77]
MTNPTKTPDTRAMGASAVPDLDQLAQQYRTWDGASYSFDHQGFARALLAQPASPAASTQEDVAVACKRCGGSRLVDDGEITGSGGVEFENGPVRCVKDCPDCATPQPSAKALTDVQIWDIERACTIESKVSVNKWDGRIEQYVTEEQYRYRLNTLKFARALLAAQPSEDKRDGTDAARDLLAERRRQVTAEGWTPEHDDQHDDSEMALAASWYAASPFIRYELDEKGLGFWPWAQEWWKPGDRRRDLVKAGALILAEIERLDRAAIAKGEGK